MTEELNGKEIHGGRELRVAILASVEVGRRSEGVDENERGLGWVVRKGHSV